MKSFFAFVLTAAISGSISHASLIALDNAANSPYSDGWQSGDNGGSGFGAWSFSGGGANSGFFRGSSADNGSSPSGNINTSGQSWGLYANNSALAAAVRPFTSGSLSAGQQFLIKMDNGFIESGGTVGFGLQNSSSQNRFEFYFVGGGSSYTINIGGTITSAAIGFTDDGLTLVFTQGSGNAWVLDVTPAGGSTSHFSGTLAASDISQLRLFNSNAGSGSDHDAFFNDIQVVPEPTNIALGILGVFMVISFGVRRILSRRNA
ncbi:MAG TPA: hypothetical protein VGF13_10900 [Verrucomicrobiae bacterium]|jgi:hypothetical protein